MAYANQAHLQMVGIFVRNALSKLADPTILPAEIIDTAVESRTDWILAIKITHLRPISNRQYLISPIGL